MGADVAVTGHGGDRRATDHLHDAEVLVHVDGNTDWFARNGYSVLWIAHWTTASQPAVPAGGWAGNGWTFWQHSSMGTPGISGPVDLDRFIGSSLPALLFVP